MGSAPASAARGTRALCTLHRPSSSLSTNSTRPLQAMSPAPTSAAPPTATDHATRTEWSIPPCDEAAAFDPPAAAPDDEAAGVLADVLLPIPDIVDDAADDGLIDEAMPDELDALLGARTSQDRSPFGKPATPYLDATDSDAEVGCAETAVVAPAPATLYGQRVRARLDQWRESARDGRGGDVGQARRRAGQRRRHSARERQGLALAVREECKDLLPASPSTHAWHARRGGLGDVPRRQRPAQPAA